MIRVLALSVLIVLSLFILETESITSSGREFYVAFFRNRLFKKNLLLSLFVAQANHSSRSPIEFSVEAPEMRYRKTFTVSNGTYTHVQLPERLAVSLTSPLNKGILVKAMDETPGELVVVAANEDEASSDSFLVLPKVVSLSGVYEYVAFSTKKSANSLINEGSSVIVIVATEDNTKITVIPSKQAFIPIPRPLVGAGDTRKFTLDRLDSTMIRSDFDLSGSYIKSDKPIAIFSGHECGNVPFNVSACDHLVEQIPPTDTWGRTYFTSPLITRSGGDMFQFAASKDLSVIYMKCKTRDGRLTKNKRYTLSSFEIQSVVVESDAYCVLESSLPFLLAQYSQGHSTDNQLISDPFLSLVTSFDQWLTSYTFVVFTGHLLPFKTYINILIPQEYYIPAAILMDGRPLNVLRINSQRMNVISFNDSMNLVAITLKIDEGTHSIQHLNPNGRLMVQVYGFADQKSHGYPGGMGLALVSVASISLKVEDTKVYENQDSIEILVVRSGLIHIPAKVTVVTQQVQGGARANRDFIPINEMVTFAPGEVEKSVYIMIKDNDIQNEEEKPLKVMLLKEIEQASVALEEGKDEVLLSILDNDASISIELIDNQYTVPEDGKIRVGVKRVGIIHEPVKVYIEIYEQKVLSGQSGNSDLNLKVPIWFNDTESEVEVIWLDVDLNKFDDKIVGGNKKLIMMIAVPDGDIDEFTPLLVNLGQQANISVMDDDRIKFSFTRNSSAVAESDGYVEVCIAKEGNTTLSFTVIVISGASTAFDGTDFEALNIELEFEPDDIEICLNVTIMNDNSVEIDEMFRLMLFRDDSQSTKVDIQEPSILEVTILDDDAVVVGFEEDDIQTSEGISAEVCVRKNGLVDFDVMLVVNVTGGNASRDEIQINLKNNILTIPGDSLTRCFGISVAVDGIAETTEFVELTLVPLGKDSQITINRRNLQLLIMDNDRVFIQFANPFPIQEGDSAPLCVNRIGEADVEIAGRLAVDFTSDPVYVPENFSVPIVFVPGGPEQVCVDISIPDDDVASGNADVFFKFEGFTVEGIRITAVPITIPLSIEDDERLTVGFKVTNYMVNEMDGQVTICISSGAFRNQERINFIVQVDQDGSNATEGEDYILSGGGRITLSLDLGSGEKEQCVIIPIMDDSIYDPNEHIELRLGLGPEAPPVDIQPNRATIFIQDNDNILFVMENSTLSDLEGNSLSEICVIKLGETSIPVTLKLITIGVSAKAGSDFLALATNVTFEPDEERACAYLALLDDERVERMERIDIMLTTFDDSDDGIEIGDPSVTKFYILDDDRAIIQFEKSEVFIQENEGFSGEVCFTNEGQSTTEGIPLVVVAVELDIPRAAKFLFDFVLNNLTFNYPANASLFCVGIPLREDDIAEANETFALLLLDNGDNRDTISYVIGERSQLNVTIVDDDSVKISFLEESIEVVEGDKPANVCVQVIGFSEIPLEFRIANAGITAQANDDFTVPIGDSLIIPADQNISCFEVVIVDDDIKEDTETFSITGSTGVTGSAVTGDISNVTILILDDDSVEFAFREPVLSANEGFIIRELCVIKIGTTTKDVTFNITLEGTAVESQDFIFDKETLVILNSQPEACFRFTLNDDEIVEGNEVILFKLTRMDLPGEDPITTMFTILDDDIAEIGFEDAVYRVSESDSFLVLNITVSNQIVLPIEYTIHLLPDTATGEDFDSSNVTKAVALFGLPETQLIQIFDDELPEGRESFRAKLSVPQESADLGLILLTSKSEATVVIADDDVVTVSFSSDTYNVFEDEGHVLLTVTTDVSATQDLSLGIYISADSADESADYVARPKDFLFIPAGQTSSEIKVEIINDTLAEMTETFIANLTIITPSSELLSQMGDFNTTIVRILDDDIVELRVDQGMLEVSESAGGLRVTGSASRLATYDVNISFTVMNDLAISGQDFNILTSSPLTLPSGETIFGIDIEILDDAMFEERESFSLLLSSANASVPLSFPPEISMENITVVTILDDDSRVVVTFEENSYNVIEDAGFVMLCIVTEGDALPSEILELPVLFEEGTAKAGSDFILPTPMTFTLQPGQARSCLNVTIQDDTSVEDAEVFIVRFPSPSSLPTVVEVGQRPSTQVVITDDDDLHRLCSLSGHAVKPFHKVNAVDPKEFTVNQTCEHVLASICNNFLEGRIRVSTDFVNGSFGTVAVRIGSTVVLLHSNGTFSMETTPSVLGSLTSEATVETQGSNVTVQDRNGTITVIRDYSNTSNPKLYIMIMVGSVDGNTCGLCGSNEDGRLAFRSTFPLPSVYSAELFKGFIDSWKVEYEDALITVERDECATMRNDSMVADPLITVPLRMPHFPENRMRKVCLCYEIHGVAGSIYNLVSDTCLTVNAEYKQLTRPLQQYNVISSIGVLATDNSGQCIRIMVTTELGCSATVNGRPIGLQYSNNGITIQKMSKAFKISVPNCEMMDIVMWTMCDRFGGQSAMKFRAYRSVNMHPTSHGLIGQFWNVPISVDPIEKGEDMYMVNVASPLGAPRSFEAQFHSYTWESDYIPCFYAGDSQADRNRVEEISVVQGHPREYMVDTLYSSEFMYSQFDRNRCES